LPGDDDDVEPALADAMDSGRQVGRAGTVVTIVTAAEDTMDTPVDVELWAGEPASDLDAWQHEVDVDLDLPTGSLMVSTTTDPVDRVAVPPGPYRLRVSSRGLPSPDAPGGEPEESYRLRLWPRAVDRGPEPRKRWSGWDGW
jgi:hypothetical protein